MTSLGIRLATGIAATAILAALAVSVLPLPAVARPDLGHIPLPEDIDFEIKRDGTTIGRHRVSFRREDDALHVRVDIRIEVRFAMLTLFRYHHENREVWRGGRLVAIETRTDDDGTVHRVRGRAIGDRLAVDGTGGAFEASADILPTSYWHPATPARDVLLDTQNGRLLRVRTEAVGDPEAGAGGRYRMRGDLELDLWYDRAGRWIGTAFEARGATVEYVRLDPGRAAGVSGLPR